MGVVMGMVLTLMTIAKAKRTLERRCKEKRYQRTSYINDRLDLERKEASKKNKRERMRSESKGELEWLGLNGARREQGVYVHKYTSLW
jgi:hypothetical protein